MALNSSCQSLKTQEAVRSQAINTSDGVSRCKDRVQQAQGRVAPGIRRQGGQQGMVGTTAHWTGRAPLKGCSHSGWFVALGNYESGVARFLKFFERSQISGLLL